MSVRSGVMAFPGISPVLASIPEGTSRDRIGAPQTSAQREKVKCDTPGCRMQTLADRSVDHKMGPEQNELSVCDLLSAGVPVDISLERQNASEPAR